MSVVREEFSNLFGVLDGEKPEQTIFKPFDVYSGMNINTASFRNTSQGFKNSNQDGRIELGMFFFDDRNINSNEYPNILGSDFAIETKPNLIENGSGKYVYSLFEGAWGTIDNPISTPGAGTIYIPEGGWGYCTYDGITEENRRRATNLYEEGNSAGGAGYVEDTPGGLDFTRTFIQTGNSTDFMQSYDNHGTIGYAGWHAYFFDYRTNLDPSNFTTNKLSDNEMDEIEGIPNPYEYPGQQTNIYGEIKTWRANDTSLHYSNFPESWYLSTNADGNPTSMTIEFIQDVTQGSPTYGEYVKWQSVGIIQGQTEYRYVRSDYNSFTDSNDYLGDFDRFIQGNQYRFFWQIENENYLPVTPSTLRWDTLLDYPQELRNYRDANPDADSFVSAPLRLQQNLIHAIKDSDRLQACRNFLLMNHYDCTIGYHIGDYDIISSDLTNSIYESPFYGMPVNIFMPEVQPIDFNNAPQTVIFPNIAKWIITNEAYSYRRCLEFLSVDFDYSTKYYSGGTGINQNPEFEQNGYQWSNISQEYQDAGMATENQYRGLNQVVKFHEGSRDAIPYLQPYSSVRISFKMKTDSNFIHNTKPQPAVEVAIVDSDGDIYSPLRIRDVVAGGQFNYSKNHFYWPNGGEFNSMTYNDDFHSNGTVNRRESHRGAAHLFQNSQYDTWEEFSFTTTLGDKFLYGDSQELRDLFFLVQAGNEFYGRVLLDDFEIVESYEFYLDCDVRKKISTDNFGKADLTKYYDKDLQPEEYKDSQAPLEAQFYFYPTYPTNELFNVKRTPIYDDFRKGLFYIKDVDWGDGSPIEFNEPEKISEDKALYHTYTDYGVYEITGLMIRKKLDKESNEQTLVSHVKTFTLRININEGLSEEFEYFGDNGFSFIPYKNTLPIIGGTSQQSSYYKSVKRQLGFVGDSKTFVEFKNDSDKLKTELALLKMENQSNDNLEVLPNYLISRIDENNNIVYNGITPIREELGKGIGDCDITSIKYYNEPKSIWEMFGFENDDLEQIGNPNDNRYWKNIIPEDYSIFNRQGINLNAETLNRELVINTYSEQSWLDNYYYPVLPKYGQDGKFIEGAFPNNNIPFPIEGIITNEVETNENLLITITSETIEDNVFNDKSGNDNLGHNVSDYKPNFDNETLRPLKRTIFDRMNTSKTNGAF